eukprot:5432163-Amphidinium_carterae.1
MVSKSSSCDSVHKRAALPFARTSSRQPSANFERSHRDGHCKKHQRPREALLKSQTETRANGLWVLRGQNTLVGLGRSSQYLDCQGDGKGKKDGKDGK